AVSEWRDILAFRPTSPNIECQNDPMNQRRDDHQPERKRGAGVKIVYDKLRGEILDLILPPGSAIDEAQLSERFRMSRTPIREALVRLAGDGLVDALPNRSTVVSNIDFLNMHAYFDALVLMYRVTTKLAAQHRRLEDIEVIQCCQARFCSAVEA